MGTNSKYRNTEQWGEFRHKLRYFLANTDGREVKTREMAQALDLPTDSHKRPLYNALSEFVKRGEVERIRKGVYVYRPKKAGPSLRDRMWAICRARQTVTIADLQEMAEASYLYAKEFVELLVKRGIARQVRNGNNFRFVMLKDPVTTPVDDEKAARLKRIREEKKKAIADIERAASALVDATQALMAARIAVNDIPEESGHDE